LDRPTGGNFGGCTMREPKLADLMVDETATARRRASLARQKAVKITVTIDTKSLHALRDASQRTGVPYQALVSRALKKSLTRQTTMESRLDHLEREVKRMKRILVA
jgi:predicted DNA binding CopG/RHH family protein